MQVQSGVMARSASVDARKPRTLVAAAKRIQGPNPDKQIPKQAPAIGEVWDYYDLVPEVKESVWYLGNQLAKGELFVAAEVNGIKLDVLDAGSGVDPQLAQAAVAELSRLSLSSGGLPELLRIANMNWEVAGEYYLVGFSSQPIEVMGADGLPTVRQAPEEWMAVSTEHIHKSEGKTFLLADPASTLDRREIIVNDPADPTKPGPDYLERMFLRHPRARNRADSLLSALRLDLAWLVALKYGGIAEANSRRNAGMLLVPSELAVPSSKAVNSDDDHPDLAEEDPILLAIDESVNAPLDNPQAASGVMPVYLKGPGDHLDKLRYLSFGRTTDGAVEALIKARVDTIARGGNLPVERVMGLQATTFANQEGVDEDELEDYHRPRFEQHCDAFTSGFLRPRLIDAGFDRAAVDQLFVWYDPSGLMRDPDPRESADYGLEHGLISVEAWLRVNGWTKDDVPKPKEILQMAALRAVMPGNVVLAVLKEMAGGALDDVSLPAPVAPGGAPDVETPEDVENRQEARLVAAVSGAVEGALRRSLVAAGPLLPRSIQAGRSGLN